MRANDVQDNAPSRLAIDETTWTARIDWVVFDDLSGIGEYGRLNLIESDVVCSRARDGVYGEAVMARPHRPFDGVKLSGQGLSTKEWS
jgi:hypothetical protein